MTERALITGAAGFVGRHLAHCLRGEGLAVHGLDLPGILMPAGLYDGWHPCDIVDAAQVAAIFDEVQPDYVFHAAALLRGDTESLLTVNVLGTKNVLDALVSVKPDTRVMVAGSSAEYGISLPGELPIRESSPLRPLSPYGVSKAAQGLLALQYTYRDQLAVVYTRTFNLTGPGEPPGLVGGDLARRIVQVERNAAEGIISVGRLTAQRDFVDVRDAAKAYWLACSRGAPGEIYNVCSGRAVQISEILRILTECSTSRIQAEVDASIFSPQDVSVSFGSAEKLRERTGWQPVIPLEESLQALLADCRQAG